MIKTRRRDAKSDRRILVQDILCLDHFRAFPVRYCYIIYLFIYLFTIIIIYVKHAQEVSTAFLSRVNNPNSQAARVC